MKYLMFIGLVIWMCSCSQQAIEPNVHCLGPVEEEGATFCENEDVGDKFCDVRYQGQYGLSERSKAFLPFYCMEPGDEVNYRNQSGEQMVFELVEKGYHSTHRLISQGLNCEQDPTLVLLDCIDHERAFVRIASTSRTFEIELVTLPDTKEKVLGKVGDFLSILREEVPGYFVREWEMVIDRKTLSYELNDCMKVYPEIILNGNTFFDVVGYDDDKDCSNYKYYVNEEFGLLAFMRSDGVLWTLDF